MPCNSDYLNANSREKYNRLTAELMVYLAGPNGQHKKDADNYYGGADYTSQLCARLKAMSKEDLDRIVYDGRNPVARKLADWWEEHQREDAIREAEEAKELKEIDRKKKAEELLRKHGLLPEVEE